MEVLMGDYVNISPINEQGVANFQLSSRCFRCPNKYNSADNFVSFIQEQYQKEEKDFNISLQKYQPTYERVLQAV
ncbi:MAG: hypothetical protein HC932_05000 [Thermales bacterium]|nr:hypothetical protein [Thermales bacterium]